MAITGGLVRAFYGSDEMKLQDYVHVSIDPDIPEYLQGSLSHIERAAIVDAALAAAVAAFPVSFGLAVANRIDEVPTEVARRG
ncbi:hypothetical protein ACIQWZ_28105 [Streptomyces sp. NPDC098077]|uniref:hypothetical protein n=1 Tax=Streptomyces sp. NPDC098077 TaxID=3366093 RepID=UPI003829CFA7